MKNTQLWGEKTQKTNHHCFSSTHMPVLKGIHGSSDATCQPSSPCLHKWERGEADDGKKSHLERCFSINMIELHQLYCQTLKTHIKTIKLSKDQKREKIQERKHVAI